MNGFQAETVAMLTLVLLIFTACAKQLQATPTSTPTPRPDVLTPVGQAADELFSYIQAVLADGQEWPSVDKDEDEKLRSDIRTLLKAPGQWKKFGRPYIRVQGKKVGQEVGDCLDQFRASGEQDLAA